MLSRHLARHACVFVLASAAAEGSRKTSLNRRAIRWNLSALSLSLSPQKAASSLINFCADPIMKLYGKRLARSRWQARAATRGIILRACEVRFADENGRTGGRRRRGNIELIFTCQIMPRVRCRGVVDGACTCSREEHPFTNTRADDKMYHRN